MNSQAQRPEKKGYVGISIGPAFPIQQRYDSYNISISGNQIKYNPNTPVGLNFTLIDLGYRFGENWGMAFSWFGTGHYRVYKSGTDKIETTSSKGGLLIGPMYSFQVKEDVYLDFKLKAGRMVFNFEEKYNGDLTSYSSPMSNIGVEIGSTLRKNISRNWSLMGNLNLHYFTDLRNKTLNLTAGIGYRI
jgi:hypothetical protein